MPKSSPAKLKYQKTYNAQPENVAKRVKNNAARRDAIRDGKASVGDGKDVAHKVALENGGGNQPANLRVEARSKNRAWRRGQDGYKVPNT